MTTGELDPTTDLGTTAGRLDGLGEDGLGEDGLGGHVGHQVVGHDGEGTWSAIQGLARALHVRESGLEATLAAILSAAVELIDGADFAGINLLRGDSFEPQAVLGRPALALDALQQQTRSGPCIDASREQQVIRVDDIGVDPRWPKYSALAASLGVQAMLCLPMWVDETRLGSVSLYSRTTRIFDWHQERLANLLAVHAAVALADAQRVENLGTALLNRDVIGQAKGVLMERHRITPDAAFAMLSEASQRTNRKLVLIAEQLASTGLLP